ncbi:MAG: DNA primase [Clostridia bacterium]|jgi:DNA primase|nr:DNA primase [Clostridia bacterium]
MAGQIPEEFINDLRHRVDIVSVIGEYVLLKKQGRNYSGLCPFHAEKTPSFTVSPDKQFYHCFGCGKGGNVFSFLMEKNGLSFPETVEFLAKRAGLALPVADVSPERARRESLKKRYYHINEITAKYYQQSLLSPSGREALKYLQGRGLENKVIEKFMLGYASSEWDDLSKYLAAGGVREEEMLALGLAVKAKNGNLVDRFRSRIMFPIMDESGRFIAFGGRITDNTDKTQAKYLNSPETALFSKGRNLYGLHLARAGIREQDRVILMEGYMDVITAVQHGLSNVVGTLGTALTVEQARLLMRYTYNTHICFDADAAGQKAALRGLDLLQEQGCNVSVITIPEAKDPDEFIRKEGRARFTEIVERAHNLLEYKLLKSMEQRNTQTIAGKVQVVQDLLPDLLKTKSPLQRQAGIQLISEKLVFPETAIHAEIRKAASLQKTGPEETVKKIRRLTAQEKAERIIIRMTAENPELLQETQDMGGQALFNTALLKEIYQNHYVIQKSGHNIKANDLITLAEDEKAQRLLAEILLENEASDDNMRVFQDCLHLLRIELLQKHINEKNSLIQELEKKGEATKALQLMAEIQMLVKEKQVTALRKGGSAIED